MEETLYNAVEEEYSEAAKILVVGVGGGGNNAVNNMISEGINTCSYIAMNTDRQALHTSLAKVKVQLGAKLTKGLGAGADPIIGEKAAEESLEEIKSHLENIDLLFIAAGMGGGTGTGAAPVIAELAEKMGILTIAVVTKPFDFEGRKRAANAAEGIEKLRKFVDTLLVIPNQKLLDQRQTGLYPDGAQKKLSLKDAFKYADDVLRKGIQGITDLIVKPAYINLDFADIRTVIKGKGIAHMGIGVGTGEHRNIEAATMAVSSSLLETRISGATALILNFVGSEDITIDEIDEACTLIREVVDPNANIIFGFAVDPAMHNELQLTVIATGFLNAESEKFRKDATLGTSAGRTMFDSSARPRPQFTPTTSLKPLGGEAKPEPREEKPVVEQKEPVVAPPATPREEPKRSDVKPSVIDVGNGYVPPFLRKLRAKKDGGDSAE